MGCKVGYPDGNPPGNETQEGRTWVRRGTEAPVSAWRNPTAEPLTNTTHRAKSGLWPSLARPDPQVIQVDANP
eukprot:5338093-Ditylum_brightwellii.AAC.1